MHGANRLGGNSLSDLLVFGKLAGDGAIKYVNNLTKRIKYDGDDIDKILKNATDILNRDEGKNPYLVHEELQSIMQQYVGIVRTGDELQNGLGKLDIIKTDIEKVYAHASPHKS
jgi:succinate dehydrogenase / fumarate reductase flavoprotein subunit